MIYMDINRYNNGKIYKITDVGYNKCYIGSTCEELSQRLARHRHQYNSYLKGKYGRTRSFEIFDEYDINNCKIELIENYPCRNKEELRMREGHHIQNTECVNRQVAGRTKQEWRDENKDYKREHDKEYRQKYKTELKEKREKRRDYYLEYNKKWKEEHKEEVQVYNKEWNEKNREKRAEKAECEICGLTIRKYDMKNHQKTQKCKSFTKMT